MRVTVVVAFGQAVRGGVAQELQVEAAPEDSVLALKQRVAAAAGGAVTADDLLLLFGPNDRKIGRQYVKDPTVDDAKLLLGQYSLLAWLQRFPHWRLTGTCARAGGGWRLEAAVHGLAALLLIIAPPCLLLTVLLPRSVNAARLLPPTPPPPGVAIHKAAASAESKDPDRAVADARAKASESTHWWSCVDR